MADVTIKYKGNTIVEMSSQGTKTLKTSGKYCEGDISVNYTPSQVPSTGDSDVVGTLDGANVLLEGNLADGTYTFKYKKKDGSYGTIGTYTLDNKVYYSVTSNLTNCTNNNEATSVIGGTSYSATITPKSGYDISSIVVTMGGTNITASAVNGNIITISNITGDIIITAIAEVPKPTYTNLAEPNDTNTTDWNIWCNNARMGSDATYRSSTNSMVTNYIPIGTNDAETVTLYFANTGLTSAGNGVTSGCSIAIYSTSGGSNKNKLAGYGAITEFLSAYTNCSATYYDDGTLESIKFKVVADNKGPYYVRFCLSNAIDKYKVIITKNEPIT
jgi:hypothetical protein